MSQGKKVFVERWINDPIRRFISNSAASGIVLFTSALVAIILSNSPWAKDFHRLWEVKFAIGFNEHFINKSLHYWINDGLMAIFFFVVGLELKREIMAGELRNPRNAILPVVAAMGGMLLPALIYFIINPTGEAAAGWGIPMATDIAFALGVLYLLGDRVPVSLKIFLTAIAIVDDLGAVLIIAFFYTSDINFTSLLVGAIFMAVLVAANLLGVRNTVFYGVVGIGGLWLAFLTSGVHATIAAVLAAFTIPAQVRINETLFSRKVSMLLAKFNEAKPNDNSLVTSEQLHILEHIRDVTKEALTPLQRLEHAMHPFVAFVVMPIFALCNAGVTLSGDVLQNLLSPVALGIFAGLLLGKVLGVVGLSTLCLRLRIASLPEGLNQRHLLGAGVLSAVGFTMSLFIAGLAFTDDALVLQAKLGILAASVFASVIGYQIIRSAKSVP
jgi:NhaA family Na+:H+ antiporter